MVAILQSAFPLRFRQIHVIHAPRLFQVILAKYRLNPGNDLWSRWVTPWCGRYSQPAWLGGWLCTAAPRPPTSPPPRSSPTLTPWPPCITWRIRLNGYSRSEVIVNSIKTCRLLCELPVFCFITKSPSKTWSRVSSGPGRPAEVENDVLSSEYSIASQWPNKAVCGRYCVALVWKLSFLRGSTLTAVYTGTGGLHWGCAAVFTETGRPVRAEAVPG